MSSFACCSSKLGNQSVENLINLIFFSRVCSRCILSHSEDTSHTIWFGYISPIYCQNTVRLISHRFCMPTYILYDNTHHAVLAQKQSIVTALYLSCWYGQHTLCNQDTQCSSRKRGARITVSMLKGRTKSRFSYLCSSVMSNMNNIKFIVEIPSTQVKPQSKFKENPFNHSLDTIQATKLLKKFLHSYSSFIHSTFAVTHKLVLWSSWNLKHLLAVQRQISASNLEQI